MPLRLFPRSSSHNAIDDHDVSMKLPGYNASSATLNMPRETLHKFEFGLHKKLSMASSRTLSELTPIPEVAAKQATSVSYITESSSSCSIVRDSPTTSFSASAGTVTNAVSKLSISKRPTSKLSFFKFLKNEKLDKKLKQQEITSKEKAAQISSVAATKVVTRVLTTSEKESRALVEREKRLAEVLSVIEGRKVLPEGLNRYRFVNFIGDGTYGFVLTAFNEKNEEVAVKFIFKEKVPQASWTRSESLGLVPAEVHYLSLLNHPSIIHFVACFEDSEYVILVTELHGTSWDSLNLKLNETNNPGLKSEPRHVRCGSEGKGDLNTLASLSATQRETLKPRVSCDLFECIDAHDKFPEYIVRRIFSQIVSAVKYLHDNNIVHRDLKDENIAIDEHYNVKLLDFGSAAFVPKTARDYFDKFLGTLDFASPEIVEGYRYRGPEAEVWALGVLLYIIVFRQIPFKSNEDIKCGQVLLPRAQDVNDPDYPDVQSLFELIRLMLNPNSVERVTLDKVVDHPWLQGSCRLD